MGIMQSKIVDIAIPQGCYTIKIQSMIPFLSSSLPVTIADNDAVMVAFHDREKWWDYLFVIDLLCWIANFFFTLPSPWALIYKITTHGYFILWLIYEWIIRKKYFAMSVFPLVNE